MYANNKNAGQPQNDFNILFFALKMSSACYVCCIYQSARQTSFFIEANNKNPDQTAPKEKSVLGPYCCNGVYIRT